MIQGAVVALPPAQFYLVLHATKAETPTHPPLNSFVPLKQGALRAGASAPQILGKTTHV